MYSHGDVITLSNYHSHGLTYWASQPFCSTDIFHPADLWHIPVLGYRFGNVSIIQLSKSLSPYSSSLYGCKDISGDKQWLVAHLQPMSFRLLSRNEAGATYFGDPEVCVTEVAMGLRPIASSVQTNRSLIRGVPRTSLPATLSAVVTGYFRSASFLALISLLIPCNVLSP